MVDARDSKSRDGNIVPVRVRPLVPVSSKIKKRISVQDCIFCKIISKEISSKIILENEQILVLQDIAPKAPIHFLIIPKKHIRDLSSCDERDSFILSDILMMAQQLSKETPCSQSFKLLMNNGHSAGQRVFHLHFHFLAGKVFSE